MAGEQEAANDIILRFALRGGIKFSKHILQLTGNMRKKTKHKIKDHIDSRGGEIKFKKLNKEGHSVSNIDISHVEDFKVFDKFAKKHGIKYSITQDDFNPETEYLWFKAANQEAINTFLKEVIDYDTEVRKDIDPNKIVDTEELIRQKIDSQNANEKTNYKLHEQKFESHEFIVSHFESFDDLKNHLSKNYDHLLIDPDVKSFNDVHSITDLEKLLEKVDQSKVKLKLERKPLLEKFKDKEKIVEKQSKEKPKNISRDTIKDKVPDIGE